MLSGLKVAEGFDRVLRRGAGWAVLQRGGPRRHVRNSLAISLAFGSILLGFWLPGVAFGEERQAAGSVLPELLSRGLDPRISKIFPDSVPEKALPSPILRDVPPSAGPREIRLQNRKAIISPNIRMHPSTITTQSEMSITTHPLSPDVVLAGANAVHTAVIVGSQGWYYTTNGGVTWGGGDTLPPHTNFNLFMADPAVGIDLDGNLFFNALLYNGSSDVIVARSTNNGTSWSQAAVPRDAGGFRDKNHLAVDVNPGSPFENYLYTAYTDFGPFPSPVMFSRSSDRGVSFSAPFAISGGVGSQFAQGINLAVGPNGELYAAWSGYDAFPPVTTHLGFNKSTDGGATWQGAFSIRNVFDIRGQLNKGGNSVRVNSFPSMAVDRSGGPRNGWIYIVYAEKNPTTPDIFLIRSTDGGNTWGAPTKVNQDASAKDQWFSWVSVDPATGHLYVVYYDSRNFPANDSAQVFISSSADGGDTFEDLLVSDVPFLPTPIPGLAGGYMGDYIGVSALNGIVWPCWNDNRTGIHQAFTSRIVFLEVGSPPKISVSPDSLDFGEVFLGYPETLSVNIRNLGFPESLTVNNIVSNNPDFTPEITNFVLPGGGVQKVKVVFNPSGVGAAGGDLTITSSDTANPTVTVTLTGEGLIAPDIAVSPDSFRVDLFTGDVAVETLTIANTTGPGGSDLNFHISIGEQSALALKLRPLRLRPQEELQRPAYKPLRSWRDFRETDNGDGNFTSRAPAAALLPPLPVVITDPAGDGGVVDITILRGSGSSGQLQIQMELATTIVPNDFGGFLSLDIDQNQATGVPPSFGNPNQDIGTEFEFLFFSLGSGIVNLYNAVTGTFVGSYPVVIGSNTLTFSAPLADLGGDDGKMDVTGVIGDAFGPTDWFPDFGHGTIGAIDFLSVSPDSGTVPAGFSMDVEVTFDAAGIAGGHFFADLLVSSNDPDEAVDTVPTHLHVIGAPNILLSPDTLDFGNAFIGFPDILVLKVFNDGTDLLEVTGMTVDNPRFSVLDAAVFNVPPGDSQDVRVQFLPIAVGPESGVLTIASSDSTDSIVTVPLLGNGLVPPDISVSPDSLEADLFTGETAVETLTVSNSGGSDLNFEISVEGVEAAVASLNERFLSGGAGLNWETSVGVSGKMADRWRPQAAARLTPSSGSGNIAVLGADGTFGEELLGNVAQYLVNSGRFASVTTINGNLITPTLAELEAFDAVGVFGWYSWLNATSIGNVLADYVDSGGSVFIAFAANGMGGGWMVQGRFNTGNYWLISPFDYSGGSPFSMGTVLEPAHPVMNGVATLVSRSKLLSGAAVDSGATLLARFADGTPLAAVKEAGGGRRADISFPLFTTAADFWGVDSTTDATLLITNAFEWLARGGANWLSVNPASGTVPAGESTKVEVTFNAAGLNGGDYFANLLLSSNDPDEPLDTTPVHLHVTGAPDIAVLPASLDFDTIFASGTAVETLTVSNEGTDLLVVSGISSDNVNFTPSPTGFSLNPGEEQKVAVTFSPTDSGTYSGQLSIVSNDTVDEPTVLVPLVGVALLPPDIGVSPDSLEADLFTGETAVETLTVANTGFSDLKFEISFEFGDAPVVARILPLEKNPLNREPQNVPLNLENIRTATALNSKTGENGAPSVTGASGVRSDVSHPSNHWIAAAGDTIRSIPAPPGNVLGLTWLDNTLWAVVATSPQQIVQLNPDNGAVLSSFPLGFDYHLGLANDGSNLWVCDFSAGLIKKYTPSGTLLTSWNAPNGSLVRGIAWEGSALWIGGANSGFLYRVDTTGAVLETRNLPFPVIAWTMDMEWVPQHPGGPLWVIDDDINVDVNQLDVSLNPAALVQDFPHPTAADGPEGIAHDGKNLWVSAFYSSRIYVVDDGVEELNWLSANPASGTVPAGESTKVEVTFNAAGLNGGDYFANLLLSSNDPDEPLDTTPVHLHVTGAPDIAVLPASLDFDTIFASGTAVETLTVSNEGTDLLVVSGISSDNVNFTPSITAFNLNPGEEQAVLVTFSPTDSGTYSGQLSIVSNDTVDEPTVLVPLVGVALLPPDIGVSPDSLEADLFTGETAVETLTVANTGHSDLNFNIFSEEASGAAPLVRINPISRPGPQAATEFRDGMTERKEAGRLPSGMDMTAATDPTLASNVAGTSRKSSGGTTASVPIPFFDSFEDGNYNGWVEDFGIGLREVTNATAGHGLYSFHYQNTTAFDHFHGIHREFNPGSQPDYVSFYVRSGSISLADAYFVLVGDPLNPIPTHAIFFFADPNGFFYVNQDQGGDNSFPYNANQWYFVEFRDINWVNKNFDYYVNGNLIKSDIGFRNAFNVNQFGGLFLYNFHASNGWWDGIRVGSGINWLSINPEVGTVPAGGSLAVEVTFNAAGLNGGDYSANILISSNDPDEPVDTTPVHLHVTGAPNIVVEPDSLDFGDAFIGYPDILNLNVSNNGSDLLEVTDISLNESHFSLLDPPIFSVPPGDSHNVRVQFLPTQPGPAAGLLTVVSTDSGDPTVSVQMRGTGIHPPCMEVSPNSFAFSLDRGDSATRTMTIRNDCLGGLDWTATTSPPLVVFARTTPRADGTGGEPKAGSFSGAVQNPARDNSRDVIRTDLSDEETFKGADRNVSVNRARSVPVPFFDSFEDSNYDGWTDDSGTGLQEVTSATAAHGTYSFHYQNTSTGHFHGIHQDFDAGSRPEYVGFYVRPGTTTLAEGYFVLVANSSNTEAIWFFGYYGRFYVNGDVGGDYSYPYNANQWYFIEFRHINWEFKTFDYYVDGGLVKDRIPFRNAGEVLQFYRLYLYNYDATNAWWDGITVGGGQFGWLSINPGSGSVPPSGNQEVQLKVRTEGLPFGTYRANILVSSNAPGNPQDTVPVTLRVIQCVQERGDLDGDGILTVADVVLELNCVFYSPSCGLCFSDVNCDSELTPVDVVLELLAVFAGFPFPC